MVMGTLGYMSPEQAKGKRADRRSDVFALGCVLYEMVTGKRAFPGDSQAESLSAILRDDPPAMSLSGRQVPAVLESVVSRCLERIRINVFSRLAISPSLCNTSRSKARPFRASSRRADSFAGPRFDRWRASSP